MEELEERHKEIFRKIWEEEHSLDALMVAVENLIDDTYKQACRENRVLLREDLNPDFLKTIDGINERLNKYGKKENQ